MIKANLNACFTSTLLITLDSLEEEGGGQVEGGWATPFVNQNIAEPCKMQM